MLSEHNQFCDNQFSALMESYDNKKAASHFREKRLYKINGPATLFSPMQKLQGKAQKSGRWNSL